MKYEVRAGITSSSGNVDNEGGKVRGQPLFRCVSDPDLLRQRPCSSISNPCPELEHHLCDVSLTPDINCSRHSAEQPLTPELYCISLSVDLPLTPNLNYSIVSADLSLTP
ncbi:hypothetical protein J6590_062487 [Homalodisca vitripennis]|nr:hypothetical protein J6590_062487 [Homalodisca vitripennis]